MPGPSRGSGGGVWVGESETGVFHHRHTDMAGRDAGVTQAVFFRHSFIFTPEMKTCLR